MGPKFSGPKEKCDIMSCSCYIVVTILGHAIKLVERVLEI